MTEEQILEWCEDKGFDEYLAPLLKVFDLEEDELDNANIAQEMMGVFRVNGVKYEVIKGSFKEVAHEFAEQYKSDILDQIPTILEYYIDWDAFFRDYQDEVLGDFSYAEETEFMGEPYCYIEYAD